MAISKEEVLHVARLARLELSDAEVSALAPPERGGAVCLCEAHHDADQPAAARRSVVLVVAGALARRRAVRGRHGCAERLDAFGAGQQRLGNDEGVDRLADEIVRGGVAHLDQETRRHARREVGRVACRTDDREQVDLAPCARHRKQPTREYDIAKLGLKQARLLFRFGGVTWASLCETRCRVSERRGHVLSVHVQCPIGRGPRLRTTSNTPVGSNCRAIPSSSCTPFFARRRAAMSRTIVS